MITYIKLSTLEYPRHEGDVEIYSENKSDYALVQETECPEYDFNTQTCEWGNPKCIDGQWYMTWNVRNLTESEIAKQNSEIPFDLFHHFWDEETLSWKKID